MNTFLQIICAIITPVFFLNFHDEQDEWLGRKLLNVVQYNMIDIAYNTAVTEHKHKWEFVLTRNTS